MKASVLFLAFLLMGCAEKQVNTKKVLSNESARSDIMENIINDDKMISQFLDKVINNEKARRMLVENRELIKMNQMKAEISNDSSKAGSMMEHLLGMMQQDSSICTLILRKMKNNPHMEDLMGRKGTVTCPMHN